MIVREKNFDIRKIAESGQCFRLNEIYEGCWQVLAGDKMLFVTEIDDLQEDDENDLNAERNVYDEYDTYTERKVGSDDGRNMDAPNIAAFDNEAVIEDHTYEFSCSKDEYESFWKSYFDLDTDYTKFINSIDKEDEYLTKAAQYGYGMRILRQDPFETLISFIISQRKNIPAIKASVEKLSRAFGHDIGGDYSFPSVKELSMADFLELSKCSLGYRASYIFKTVEMINTGKFDLDKLKSDQLTSEELTSRLMALPGVGIKVANCTSLFGFHRLEAFPRDVWIKRIEDKYYNGHFDEDRYPGFAGVLQQYMFYYERTKTLKRIKD